MNFIEDFMIDSKYKAIVITTKAQFSDAGFSRRLGGFLPGCTFVNFEGAEEGVMQAYPLQARGLDRVVVVFAEPYVTRGGNLTPNANCSVSALREAGFDGSIYAYDPGSKTFNSKRSGRFR